MPDFHILDEHNSADIDADFAVFSDVDGRAVVVTGRLSPEFGVGVLGGFSHVYAV